MRTSIWRREKSFWTEVALEVIPEWTWSERRGKVRYTDLKFAGIPRRGIVTSKDRTLQMNTLVSEWVSGGVQECARGILLLKIYVPKVVSFQQYWRMGTKTLMRIQQKLCDCKGSVCNGNIGSKTFRCIDHAERKLWLSNSAASSPTNGASLVPQA